MGILKTTRVGSTLVVHDDSDTAKQVIQEMIVPNGHAAIANSGAAEWIIDEAVVDLSKSGSDQYTWDRSGNKVKHARKRYKRDAAGNVASTVERFIYKALD